MKTKYKWIRFEKEVNSENWLCFNTSDELLGTLYYKQGWRQFVVLVNPGVGYSDGFEFNFCCLEDIADFLKQLNNIKGCYKGKL